VCYYWVWCVFYLHFVEPERVVVGFSSEVFIGREGFDVVVRADGAVYKVGSDLTVSRVHARIYVDRGKCYIVDLGSLNGTLVNGELVRGWEPRRRSEPVELPIGSVVRVGLYTVFRVDTVGSRSLEKDRLAILQYLLEQLADAALKLEGSPSDAIQIVKYILSRDSLRKELENTHKESVEGIEHYVDLISRSPHSIYDREIVASLRNRILQLRDLVKRELELRQLTS